MVGSVATIGPLNVVISFKQALGTANAEAGSCHSSNDVLASGSSASEKQTLRRYRAGNPLKSHPVT